MDNKSIGKLLAEARINGGYTQADMCDPTGLTKNHISYMERGQGKATVKMLLGYCDKLNLTPSQILQYRPTEARSVNYLLRLAETLSKDDKKTLITKLVQSL